MTLDQAFAFAIILGTMGLLIWGRIRYDVVALVALLISIACGIVKPKRHSEASATTSSSSSVRPWWSAPRSAGPGSSKA